MTLSTSAVAVCCASDSAQLAQQPRILDGDHRLRGEVLDQLDLLVAERPHLLPVNDDAADQFPLMDHGGAERRCAGSTSALMRGLPAR